MTAASPAAWPVPEDEAGRLRALQTLELLEGDPEAGFEHVVDLARTSFDVPIAAVVLLDATRQWFCAVRGLAVAETPREHAFCGHTILDDAVMVVPDARADPRFAANPLVTGPPHIRFYAGAPLRTPDGYRIGSLCVIDARPRVLDARERAMLERMRDVVLDVIELRRAARFDALTGARTRAAWMEEVAAALRLAAAEGGTVGLLLLDLDHFKSVNDTLGHAAGDDVLRAVGRLLLERVRAPGSVCRHGGEEFAVLLPRVTPGEALAMAEALRTAIAASDIPLADGPATRVTASVGVACARPGERAASLFERADAALYAAKRRGRNRSVPCPAASAG